MDHFLSGLEHGANTWYAATAAPRAAALHAAQSHEFAVGPSECLGTGSLTARAGQLLDTFRKAINLLKLISVALVKSV